MTNLSATAPGDAPEARGIQWGWLLALGILMTALGVFGLGATYLLTAVAVFWFGVLAIVGGIAQLLDAFHHRKWKGIVWHVIIAAVYIAAGILLITTPVSAAFWLTLFLAISLAVTGIMRIVMAFQVRGQGSIWLVVLLSGIVSIALGVMVYGTVMPLEAGALATPEGQLEWLLSWGWVIGLFVAIELIMGGIALISIALAARRA